MNALEPLTHCLALMKIAVQGMIAAEGEMDSGRKLPEQRRKLGVRDLAIAVLQDALNDGVVHVILLS